VAVVWGPLAGYYAQRESTPLDVRPITAAASRSPSRFMFDIAMGVRRDDPTLRAALDGVITRRGDDMRRILRAYGVPLR
jgi:mxaJ protein